MSNNDKTIAHALVEKIIKMALHGYNRVIKLIWDAYGRQPPKYDRDPRQELPPKRRLADEEIKKIDEVFGRSPDQRINVCNLSSFFRFI